MPRDVAFSHQQLSVTRFPLAGAVPEQTRRAVERLQLLHMYGLLCYDLFTVADTQSWLTLDLALAERFVAFYGGQAPFVVAEGADKGSRRPLAYGSWEDVHDALRHGSHRGRGVHLQPRSGARSFRFTGLFDGLLRWARDENLLRGQRNRQIEQVYRRMRNDAAHPRYTSTLTPVESVRSIRDTVEIINQLWGHPTPGGQLYPAPLERSTVIVGWAIPGTLTWFRKLALNHTVTADLTETTFIALRAVADDDLRFYNASFENTTYPAELLWGPGTQAELRAWAADNDDQADTVDYLDRLFVVRATDRTASPPMRPSVAAGLQDKERLGQWHLLRADYPADASQHARALANPNTSSNACTRTGACPTCAVETVRIGSLDAIVAWLRQNGHRVLPERPPLVAVPPLF